MGVPGFFGWIVQHCRASLVPARHPTKRPAKQAKDEEAAAMDRLSGRQMDCLYLDLNGIIHPCCHPESDAPSTEAEMMARICKKIDEIVDLVAPTTLIFIAIDGTAPRAKMNQQRTRRFRAAEMRAKEKQVVDEVKEEWAAEKIPAPSDDDLQSWDSNVITPGTAFMEKVHDHLKYYIALRMETNNTWKKLTVVLSGSNEPGEGEHKIIQYIKRQRLSKNYDPQMTHCIVGEDADLIMLALSVHTPHIHILRTNRPPKAGGRPVKDYAKYNYLVVSVVAGYFEKVFAPIVNDESLPPEQRDVQRLLDDLTLVFCLVGNDFLPHIPGMKIQHNAIGVSLLAYVDGFKSFGGYLTDNGDVNLQRLSTYLAILKRNFRTVTDKAALNALVETMTQKPPPPPPSLSEIIVMTNPADRVAAFQAVVKYKMDTELDRDIEEQKANDPVSVGTADWEARYYATNFSEFLAVPDPQNQRKKKKKKSAGKRTPPKAADEQASLPPGPRLFASVDELEKDVSREYLLGLCWVVRYYFQACPSWAWFYPYHYSPVLTSIVVEPDAVSPAFAASKPYTPYQQLAAVLPISSARTVLPPTIVKWLTSKKSPLAPYYPSSFRVDLRSCPPPWHCTVLLPFLDDAVYLPILKKLEKKAAQADPSVASRTARLPPLLFFGPESPLKQAADRVSAQATPVAVAISAAGAEQPNGGDAEPGKKRKRRDSSPADGEEEEEGEGAAPASRLAVTLLPADNALLQPHARRSGLALESPFPGEYESLFPSLKEVRVTAVFGRWPGDDPEHGVGFRNTSDLLPGTVQPDHSKLLAPSSACRKPSFTFDSKTVRAGLPLVLIPGKALDSLQQHWSRDKPPCWHFTQFGTCKFGDACHYAHTTGTGGGGGAANNSSNNNSGSNTVADQLSEQFPKTCRFYERTGTCRFGDACRFAHTAAAAPTTTAAAAPTTTAAAAAPAPGDAKPPSAAQPPAAAEPSAADESHRPQQKEQEEDAAAASGKRGRDDEETQPKKKKRGSASAAAATAGAAAPSDDAAGKVWDASKLYVTGGPSISRDALSEYIKSRTGHAPLKVKWKTPGGKQTGTVVVRFGSAEAGSAVHKAIAGQRLPAGSSPLSVEMAPHKEAGSVPQAEPSASTEPSVKRRKRKVAAAS